MLRDYEEILEAIYQAHELEEDSSLESLEESCHGKINDKIIKKMINDKLIIDQDGNFILSEKGKEMVRPVIRRKRLAEVLFQQVFGSKDKRLQEAACEYEHAVFPELEEGICTLLGHPTHCPHDREIPPGPCCLKMKSEVTQVVKPLTDLLPGEKGRVAYLKTKGHIRQHKFSGLGIRPGIIIELHQKYPAYIIKYENIEVAMDEDNGKDIFLWPVND